MIIENTDDLRLLTRHLRETLSAQSIHLKSQRAYELIAQCQGFDSDAALRANLPIWLDSSSAEQSLRPLLHRYATGLRQKSPFWSPLSKSAYRAKPFPVLGIFRQKVEMSINWEMGNIHAPYVTSRANEAWSKWQNDLGFETRYDLGDRVAVTESEFSELVHELQPLVETVQQGLTVVSSDIGAQLTNEALETRETVGDIIDNFSKSLQETLVAVDYYSEEGALHIEPDSVIEAGLSSVDLGVTEISAEMSDIDLRKMVAFEMLQISHPCSNGNELFDLFESLRDACRHNQTVEKELS